jgi:hypothetical protein
MRGYAWCACTVSLNRQYFYSIAYIYTQGSRCSPATQHLPHFPTEFLSLLAQQLLAMPLYNVCAGCGTIHYDDQLVAQRSFVNGARRAHSFVLQGYQANV